MDIPLGVSVTGELVFIYCYGCFMKIHERETPFDVFDRRDAGPFIFEAKFYFFQATRSGR